MPNKNIKALLKRWKKEKKKREKVLSPSPSGVRLPGDCLALYACPACESRRCRSDLWIFLLSRLSFDVIDEDRRRSSPFDSGKFIYFFFVFFHVVIISTKWKRFLVTLNIDYFVSYGIVKINNSLNY